MIVIIVQIINYIVLLITILVIAKVFLSYFIAPYHPVRVWIDRIIEPMLRPIRRVVPLIGMLDLSPLILIILVGLIGRLITSLLLSIFR